MNNENKTYKEKVDYAIKLLRTVSSTANQVIELSYSGGKDSDVILHLAQQAGIAIRPIYKNTTIDPPGTLKHCRDNNVEIFNPKQTFLQLIANKGMPTRRARFCCSTLKEYKIMNYAIQGIRRSESVKRAKNYRADEPIICRLYGSKKNHANIILPILNWTDEDVERYITENKIQCHPLYYNQDGSFNVKQRLGCLGCPLQGDQGVAEFKAYPKLLKAISKQLKIWWTNHPNTQSHKKFRNIYDLMAHNLLFRTYDKFYKTTYTLFGIKDWQKELSSMFNIEL